MNALVLFFPALPEVQVAVPFGVKSSTARISSHLSNRALSVLFAARCYLPQKYFAIRQAICQHTVNRG